MKSSWLESFSLPIILQLKPPSRECMTELLRWPRFSQMFIYSKRVSNNFPPTKLGQKTDYFFNRISVAKHRACFVALISYRQQPLPQIWSPLVTKSADQTPFSLTIFRFLLSNYKLNWDRVSNVSIDKCLQWHLLHSCEAHFWEVAASIDKAIIRSFIKPILICVNV